MTRLLVIVSITMLTGILGPLGLARAEAGPNERAIVTVSSTLPSSGASPSGARFGGQGADIVMSLTEPRDSAPARVPAATNGRPAETGDAEELATATRRSLTYRVAASVGAALLSVLVVGAGMVGVQRARRRRVTRWYRVPTQETAVFTTSTPTRDVAHRRDVGPPPTVGWHADPDHLSDQVYWDGQSWMARRRWSGTAWVEVE
jgi:hypothetical protein